MTIAQMKGARKRGNNYRKLNGPKPVSKSKAASRLRRVVETQRRIQAGKKNKNK